jgi:hypothetical protein
MTKEELKAKLDQNKLNAFNQIWMSRDVDPKHTGYNSREAMAWGIIERTAKENEKLLQKWERENPA